MKPDSSPKMTASKIREAMAKKWASPEYAIMWEVADGTGAVAGRRADAVIMSLWPSRGLELHGVEIKISRADWRREATDPAKAESIARFCDRWWIHTPPGIVQDISELPPNWGLREFDGRKWRTVREAEKFDPEPPTRAFLAALLRRADGIMKSMMDEARAQAREEIANEQQKWRDQEKQKIEREVAFKTRHLQRRVDAAEQFVTAFGIDPKDNYYQVFPQEFGQIVSNLMRLKQQGIMNIAEKLNGTASNLKMIAELFPKDLENS